MKVMHVNCTDSGSTGKLIYEIAKYSNNKMKSILCTPKIVAGSTNILKKYKTSNRFETAIYKRITAIIGYRYRCSPISTKKIISVINSEKPDIIHFHSANCYMANLYKLFKYVAKKNIAAVITNHAEFYYTGTCPHSYECNQWINGCKKCPDLWNQAHSKLFDKTYKAWYKMKNSLSSIQRLVVVSVSPWQESRSEKSGIMKDIKQDTILNGVDINTFKILDSKTNLKDKYGLKGKVVLCVTSQFTDRDDDTKGGKYIIELSKMFGNNVTFVVVGQSCVLSHMPSNIISVGKILNQNILAEYYNLADVTISVGKRETYGMTIAESLCCGTPVAGFEAGGPESIALKEYSTFVPYGNTDKLYTAIYKYLYSFEFEELSCIEKSAHQKYDATLMAEKYCCIYKNLLSKQSYMQ